MTEVLTESPITDSKIPDREDKPAEIESSINPQRHLYDILRLPENDSQRITAQIEEVSRREIGDPPRPEIQKVFEAASGIFLWQYGMRDTGGFLPVGLTFWDNPYGCHDQGMAIQINKEFLTMDDYMYVMNIFRREGILDEVAGLQRNHRETHREEIEKAMATILRESQLMDYLNVFGVGEAGDSEEVPIEPGSVAWQRRRSELHGSFREAYGSLPKNGADPMLRKRYVKKVEMPLRRSTMPADDTTLDKSGQNKALLRSYLRANYFARSGLVKTVADQNGVIVRDGEFLFPQRDGNSGAVEYIKDDRLYVYPADGISFTTFTSQELWQSGPDLGLLSNSVNGYGVDALRRILPSLYDPKNPKEFEVIIDECIDETAREIADRVVHEPFLLLNDIPDYGWERFGAKESDPPYDYGSDVREQLIRLVWLTNTTRNTYGKHSVDRLDSGVVFHTERLSWDGAESSEDQGGDILFATPEVFASVPQRIISYRNGNGFDTHLPRIPADVDLCIKFSDLQRRVDRNVPTSDDGTVEGILANCNPKISGMELVARADDICYFRLVDGKTSYGPVEAPSIPLLKIREVAALCDRIGMHDLATTLSSQESITAAQLINLTREHFVPEAQQKDEQIIIKTPYQLADRQLIDAEGRLHGTPVVFEYFLRSVLNIGLERKDSEFYHLVAHEIKGDILSKDGIRVGNFAQTQVGLDYRDKVYIVDPLIPALPDKKQTTERREEEYDDYDDRPVTISIPGRAEWNKQLNTKIGSVESVNVEVFGETDSRLVLTRERNNALPDSIEQYDLVVVFDQQVANRTTDPYITGMKLVARDGQRCYFQLDGEKNMYIPARKEISPEQKRMLLSLCQELGIKDLVKMLEKNEYLSVASFVERARNSMKGYIPKSASKERYQSIYSLLENGQIDSSGKIRGGPEVFNYFLRSVLVRLYGEDSVQRVTGFALQKYSTEIVATVHEQTQLKIPARSEFPEESVDCLLSVEPNEEDAEFSSSEFREGVVEAHLSSSSRRPVRPGQRRVYPPGYKPGDPLPKQYKHALSDPLAASSGEEGLDYRSDDLQENTSAGQGSNEMSVQELINQVGAGQMTHEEFANNLLSLYERGEEFDAETLNEVGEVLKQLPAEQLTTLEKKIDEISSRNQSSNRGPYDDSDERAEPESRRDYSARDFWQDLRNTTWRDFFPDKEERVARRELRRRRGGPDASVESPVNEVVFGGREEYEKNIAENIGEILWHDEHIFDNVNQRLIRRKPRNSDIASVSGDAGETDMLIAGAELAIKILNPKLADATHDPYIYGMQLIGRDEQRKIYYYKREKEDIYKKVDNIIPQRKLKQEAAIFAEIEMHALSRALGRAERLSLSDLVALDREYVVWHKADGEVRPVVLSSRKDLLEEGFIDRQAGILEGACDVLEFFLRDQGGELYGKDAVSRVVGYSLNRSRYISEEGHAQTLFDVPKEGIHAIIDIEPDPAKTKKALGRDDEYAPVVQETSEDELLDFIRAMIKNRTTEAEVKPFVIPQPDVAPSDLVAYRYDADTDQRIKVYGEEAKEAIDSFEQQYEDDIRVAERFKSARALYVTALLRYLGVTDAELLYKSGNYRDYNEFDDFDNIDIQIHDIVRKDLHQGREFWRNIPHLLVFSIIRDYQRFREEQRSLHQYEARFTVADEDLTLASELLQLYKDHSEETSLRYHGQQLPSYNPTFIKFLERMVDVYSDINRIGGIR